MNISPTITRYKGFALIVTLSLMILLTVIAVGLLTLSSVSLRVAGQGEAMATARANARLALMLALGDLQKNLGPDRAVTATSEILATPATPVAKPNCTGVWESWWDFNPSAAPNYSTMKTTRFRRWLVSSADVAALEFRTFATTAWTGKTVELVGKGSLGTDATAANKVVAGLVPLFKNGKVQGSCAWHIADESVKARVNLYRDPSRKTTLAQTRALLAGHRPDPSVMKGPNGNPLNCLPSDLEPAEFAKATASVAKVIDLSQAELLEQATGKIKPFRNDITPYSLGVMADVRGGGLKQDLSSIFEMSTATAISLPTEFNNKKLYQSTHGITGVSDPNWSALAAYYNVFRSLSTPETSPTFAVTSGEAITTAVPTNYNPAPVIAKVDTIFSLVTREATASHLGIFAATKNIVKKYDYNVNLIFTPVITLHNPYNVNLSFQSMEVTFTNTPVAFRFMLQVGGTGEWQSQSIDSGNYECLNEMVQNKENRGDKKFIINIANWAKFDSTSPSGPIVMKPGQTLVCGPYMDPQGTFWKDSRAGENTVAFDWNNKLTGNSTKPMKAKPGFTPGLGFEINCITPSSQSEENQADDSWWMFLLRDGNFNSSHPTDRFYVEFEVQQPGWQKGNADNQKIIPVEPSFAVSARLQTTASGKPIDYASLKFDYTDPDLKNFFNNRIYTYPPTAPTDSLTGSDTFVSAMKPYNTQAGVRPFAIFSAYARTTGGGVYETGKRTKSADTSPQVNLLKDGTLAGKPFLFHNPARANVVMNLANGNPGAQPYELNFQPFLSKGDYEDYMDVEGNRVPFLTGNKTGTGIKSGSYLELPSGPLQTLADFRRSNALTTNYLPHFVQPVGNSLLHPLMSPDKVVETNSAVATTALLDHSVLANHALYDRFYFSTFATRGATTPDEVFEQFMSGTAPLASQSFQSYLPPGKTVAAAKAELFTSGKPNSTAYKGAAQYQMIQGPFNVNSTSVQAWKAVLASMKKGEIATLWARTAGLEIRTAAGVPISAMSMINGGVTRTAAVDPGKIDSARSNDWNGYRELTDQELENLAVKIVDQVRDRGPFLSMSEFVNRQVGPLGPRTLTGALESAITEAEINQKKNEVFPNTFLAQVPITAADISDGKIYNYKTKEASIGNPAAGAPGWINQGDLLRILEPSATVRGDTFVIRAYGESQDSSGKIAASAYAEAVVQRLPEYVDPVDSPSLNAYDTAGAPAVANKTFGRRMSLVSFRWLSSNEI